MNLPTANQIIDSIWSALGVYWVISARQSGATKTPEAHSFRAVRFLILGTTFVLLLSDWLRIGPLAWRFIPDNFAVRAIGIGLTVAGITVTVWARICLGRNWSDKVVIKEDHELIRSGPYAYMRHPIYSGVLLGVAGTALAIGEWRGVVAFCLLLTTYAIKAKKEERVLAGAFGAAFEEHARDTGFLLPRIHFGTPGLGAR
ncbi:MAG: isoprenylcysteine carboxylmethyltransferase family protein [Candidatus Acidiferrales bacterium]|jgi:protein-S-isoprenylcysteine O-methyltransferase Ste14